jgi:hypothetical protein
MRVQSGRMFSPDDPNRPRSIDANFDGVSVMINLGDNNGNLLPVRQLQQDPLSGVSF